MLLLNSYGLSAVCCLNTEVGVSLVQCVTIMQGARVGFSAGVDPLGCGWCLGVTLGSLRKAAQFLESLGCAHSALSVPQVGETERTPLTHGQEDKQLWLPGNQP